MRLLYGILKNKAAFEFTLSSASGYNTPPSRPLVEGCAAGEVIIKEKEVFLLLSWFTGITAEFGGVFAGFMFT